MSRISGNLQAVLRSIALAAHQARREPADVALLAVSKTWSAEDIVEAARAGQRAFGENYEQEAVQKKEEVCRLAPDIPLEWHFIGPIQSNKTRAIAAHFDWVHTVDREKIARRLSEQRPAHLPPLNVCLQVNISHQGTKNGVAPEGVLALANAVSALPRLRLRGLMAIPAPEDDEEKQRAPFQQLKQCYTLLREKGFRLDTLSMGMSADMVPAIREGATIVRIGTAIFGARNHDDT
ncbi:MAG: YggS family pyridoxal phosphate-dependent enzyme [Burkholderiaceae bacterium]|jgi:pyridoxal phosphate enzyme (YggS family)|nr:YggS family pyridoxal phosphate-dependent enzyme [Burkholderiaceae bacterium]